MILAVGRLAEKKGFVHLVEALSRPPLCVLQWGAVVIGDGPLRPELERRCGELGLGARVRFLGAQPYDQVAIAMASAVLLAAPSVRARDGDCEGLPTVILEALASGLPVVTTNNGGISEVIEDGVTGRLVPEGDPDALSQVIVELLQDPVGAATLAKRGRHRVADYDWAHIAAAYARILEGALVPRP